MTLADRIAPHLPYLRRYARALTGSQTSGDAYVAALLEALIANPSMFPSDGDDKVELYRLLSQMWGSLDVNLQDQHRQESWEALASQRLEAITPRARQAFILLSVEGFGIEETTRILGATIDETNELIDQASSEIAEQVATSVLIIEDEPLIAMDIESLVTGLGHNVVGIARTRTEAVAKAEEARPGLVLADIQLADGSSGIDAVNDILGSFDVPVIFITAYPERLLTGDRPEPAFLITKPFLPDMVKAIISQSLFFREPQGSEGGGREAVA